MEILASPTFLKSIKKLQTNQKKSLDKAVKAIALDPSIGDSKVGDLAGIYVYKFRLGGIRWLLAYRVVNKRQITLLMTGPHENFYRDLKKSERVS